MNLTDLEALEAEATPGPWTVEDYDDDGWLVNDTTGFIIVDYSLGSGSNPRREADAAFIAALRNAAPELIRLARLGEAWEAAEAALPEFWHIRSLMLTHPYSSPVWEVVAADQRRITVGRGATPAAALIALAAALQEGADRG